MRRGGGRSWRAPHATTQPVYLYGFPLAYSRKYASLACASHTLRTSAPDPSDALAPHSKHCPQRRTLHDLWRAGKPAVTQQSPPGAAQIRGPGELELGAQNCIHSTPHYTAARFRNAPPPPVSRLAAMLARVASAPLPVCTRTNRTARARVGPHRWPERPAPSCSVLILGRPECTGTRRAGGRPRGASCTR